MTAATLWQAVFACELAIAIVLALAVTAAAGLTAWAALPISLGMLVFVQYSLVALSMAASQALARSKESATRIIPMLRATFSETLYFGLAILAMSVEPWSRRRDADQACVAAARPVLLVHGLACNRAVWGWLIRRLRESGSCCIHTVNLEPLGADIDHLAGTLERDVLRIHHAHGDVPVTIVGHSMGGLVARVAARSLGPRVIGNVITLGTPHHGAGLAHVLPVACVVQMRRGSSWLSALNVLPEGSSPAPLTSIYSLEDNFVVPIRSDSLPGARVHELHGLGHFGLLASPDALDIVMRTLSEHK